MLSRWLIIFLILALGGAMLSPVVMMFDPDPLPGDFSFDWHQAHIHVPVIWSLCASGVLALLYSVLKR